MLTQARADLMRQRILTNGFFVRNRPISCELCHKSATAGICEKDERRCICLKCAAEPFSYLIIMSEKMDHAKVIFYLDSGKLRYEPEAEAICDNCGTHTPVTIRTSTLDIDICLRCAKTHTDNESAYYEGIEENKQKQRELDANFQRMQKQQTAERKEIISRVLTTPRRDELNPLADPNVIFSRFIYPASRAYGGKGAVCDSCRSDNLCAVIQFGEEDVCMSCILENGYAHMGIGGKNEMSAIEIQRCLETAATLRYAKTVDGFCDNCSRRTNVLVTTGVPGEKDLCIRCCLDFHRKS